MKNSRNGSQRLRILRIITRLNVGGPSLQVANHCRELPGLGIDQTLSYGKTGDREGDLSPLLSGTDVRIHPIPSLVRPIHPWKDLISLLRLIRLIRKVQPELVHTHLFKAGALGRLASILTGVRPRVHTLHGTVFQGHFGPFSSRIAIFLERRLARFTDVLVVLSPSQAEHLTAHRIAPSSKIRVIPPGFDLERFSHPRTHRESIRRELETPPGSPVVAILGRLAPVKNISLALRVIAGARKKIPQLCCWIAGDGPLMNQHIRERKSLGLSETSVQFLGFREDPHRILAGADALLLTSRSEGLPVAIIEALASSRPVVATEVGGVGDLIQHEENGYLAPEGDEQELTRGLVRTLEAVDKKPFAEPNLPLLQRFSIASAARAHRELYDELIEKTGTR